MDLRNNLPIISASSGNVAAATATATLPAVTGKTTYITGFSFTGLGATAASTVNLTTTGLTGTNQTYNINVPAGVTTTIPTLVVYFDPAIPASGVNTAITVTVPSLGAGNTNAAVNAWGYQL